VPSLLGPVTYQFLRVRKAKRQARMLCLGSIWRAHRAVLLVCLRDMLLEPRWSRKSLQILASRFVGAQLINHCMVRRQLWRGTCLTFILVGNNLVHSFHDLVQATFDAIAQLSDLRRGRLDAKVRSHLERRGYVETEIMRYYSLQTLCTPGRVFVEVN
jgi:hypothetical protein